MYLFFVCGFIGDMGHTNVQMRKCTNSCSRLNESSASLIEITHICAMVVAQLFEVTVAADGTELSSKRVSKLSRRYHLHKKQLRQSAMMAEGLSDENQDYQRCMDTGCDTVRPGGIFDTSEFALSTQPPSTSSIRRSTTSVADNHPAVAARRAKKKNPPPRESPGRDAKKKACENITLLSGRKQNPTVTRLPSRPPRPPPPPLRDFTPPPPIARPLVSDSLDN